MLTIRTKQMHVLQGLAAQSADERLLQHARQFYPLHARVMGDDALRRTIRLARERAAARGFLAEREQGLYLGVALSLGSYFDEDLQLPWVAEMLSGQPLDGRFAQLERLSDRARAHTGAVNGPDGAAFKAALARFGTFGVQTHTELATGLRTLFPEKCAVIGEDALRQLIGVALVECQSYGMDWLGGIFLYAGIMLLLGQRFDRDPQFPWAAEALTAENLSPTAKARRFWDEGVRQRALWTA